MKINKIILALSLGFLISCKTITYRGQEYKKLKFSKIIKLENEDGKCKIEEFLHYQNRKPLNGNYKLIYDSKAFEYTTLKNGKYNGRRDYFLNGNISESTEYIDGIKHGKDIYFIGAFTQKDKGSINKLVNHYKMGVGNGDYLQYIDGNLHVKSTFENGIKTGKEYFFNEKGDTLNITSYSFNPHYDYFANYTGIYWDENPPFIGKLNVHFSNSDFAKPENLMSLVRYDLNCKFKGSILISFKDEDYLFLCNSNGCDEFFKVERIVVD